MGRTVPVLETERLMLTVPAAADVDELLAYRERNLEHLARWSPPEAPDAATRPGALRLLERMAAEWQSGSSLRLWLRYRSQPAGPFVGSVSLAQIYMGPFRACYLGYQLDRAAVGQGLMHEALTRVIRYAFDELELHRIMANYLPTNERSGRVLRRLGFVVEGYARDYLFIDGKFRDHVLTALTNSALDGARLCTPQA